MGKKHKNELDLYRLLSQDDSFKIAMVDTLMRILMVDDVGEMVKILKS